MQIMCMTPCIHKSIYIDTNQTILNNMFKKWVRSRLFGQYVDTARRCSSGLFAIAVATSLGYGDDPAKSTFQQENLSIF